MNPEYVHAPIRYKIGIDVGTHSTGFCAVEVDSDDRPVSLLNSVVFLHDSGLDPSGAKKAETRKFVSGIARRTRRLIRQRHRRLLALDQVLTEMGLPLVNLEENPDPLYPWWQREKLVGAFIEDEVERTRALSIAFRHIARHRGWRSAYARVESLLISAPPSNFLCALKDRVSEKTGREIPEEATPGEVICTYLRDYPLGKLRGPEGILGGKLAQSDNANEIRLICDTQRISEEDTERIIRAVFHAKSPRGSASGRVGKDALPGQGHLRRAEKAHPAFQSFRIVSVLANLRVRDSGGERRLTKEELSGLYDYLLIVGADGHVSWADLADQLGVERRDLLGTARPGADGEPALSRPPVDVTHEKILQSKIGWLKKWWLAANDDKRCALVDALSASGGSGDAGVVDDEVVALLENATEEDFEKIDKIDLPQGRAAYSVDSLRRLTREMLETGCDLTEARGRVFKVPSDWVPPAEPIGAPVGNPAVDRVLKQVARWLESVQKRWGSPISVNIEHVRNALGSERVAREMDKERKRREKKNRELLQEMQTTLGISGKARRSDRMRYKAISRQNGNCLYCGSEITYETMEMDHIVPRSNGASTNTMTNLAAVCRRCNHSKSNIPFAVWAASDAAVGVDISEVQNRVRTWTKDNGISPKIFKKFQAEVLRRLKAKKPDEEIDARSMESVAWMANELRQRIEGDYRSKGYEVDVCVYRGELTAEARKVRDFENRCNLIGGGGKTRLDRRHHAMDALVIALMTRSVARTLALRLNIRDSEWLRGANETWKNFHGAEPAAREKWEKWVESMLTAVELFNLALAADEVPLLENLRLRVGSGAVHEDSIRPLVKIPLSSEMTPEVIDRAASPALWNALVRHKDFDQKTGLPADDTRVIRLNGEILKGDDSISFFPSNSAFVQLRGGCAFLGDSIHHARIYKIEGKKTSYSILRVYQIDVAKRRKEDVFTVPLPDSSISVRAAEKKLKEALRKGSAVQIGWLVLGDELSVQMLPFSTGKIGEFLEEYPMATRWRVSGFPSETRLRLRPLLLSAEGLGEEESLSGAVKEILSSKGQGWRPAANKLFSQGSVQVIRRNALGEMRTRKGALPSSYMIE